MNAQPSAEPLIEFATEPSRYKHWRLASEGSVATLTLDVKEDGGIRPNYLLKLNSYDIGVDIELYDAIQRLRFEHPEVKSVIVTSAKDRVFCAGANIPMLGISSHMHKVNFCKFTNETRNFIEDASEFSGQKYICAINGTAAGGGYELALATDHIVMADDGSTAVSLPEVPLLAVLPGTGGLTRLVDKRKVRRDRADYFCTLVEGIKGKRAVDWRLVDQVVPRSKLMDAAKATALELAKQSSRPDGARGVALKPLAKTRTEKGLQYRHVSVEFDQELAAATITIRGPENEPPKDFHAAGTDYWPLALARELDDAILDLRFNQPYLGTWVLKTRGDAALVAKYDSQLLASQGDWLGREILHYLKRCLKRVDLSARSLIAVVDQGSCFAGTLLELALASDKSYMLMGALEGSNLPPAAISLTAMNFGPLPMSNGITRLESRYLAEPGTVKVLEGRIGESLEAEEAEEIGLVTFAPDDIDWADELRLALEERASYSPDALTGMEANLRFCGPETMETKIFARLSAWQNWIFQRPNAVGETGALKLYGSGQQAKFDRKRV